MAGGGGKRQLSLYLCWEKPQLLRGEKTLADRRACSESEATRATWLRLVFQAHGFHVPDVVPQLALSTTHLSLETFLTVAGEASRNSLPGWDPRFLGSLGGSRARRDWVSTAWESGASETF